MNTLKMIAEIKSTCQNLSAEKNELVARVKEIDDRLTAYRMAVESLELTVADRKLQEMAPAQAETAAPATHVRCRKDSRLIEYNGKTQSVAQWAEELGIAAGTLRYRLRNGWSVEQTLSLPLAPGFCVKKRPKKPRVVKKVFAFDAMGNTVRQYVGVSAAAKDLKLPESTVRKILDNVSKEDQLKSHDYYLAYAF